MPHEEVKEQNIERVLQTAYELFLANGIEGTTKEMLVRASGISRSSVNRYFANKLDCVLQTAQWAGKNVWDGDPRLCQRFSGGSASGFEMLRTYMETVRDLLYQKPQLFVLGAECRAFVCRNCTDYDSSCGQLYQTLGSSYLLRKIFERGVEDGSIKSGIVPEKEAIITRESTIGFFTSIAISCNQKIMKDCTLTESYIERVLSIYATGKE